VKIAAEEIDQEGRRREGEAPRDALSPSFDRIGRLLHAAIVAKAGRLVTGPRAISGIAPERPIAA
jgi:hypothetical protein